MRVGQLQSILNEYRPSMKLIVIVEQQRLLQTTVVEMLIKLVDQPREALLTFYGRSDCIIRERGEATDDVAGAPPYREWLEIDLR
jgi:hypothetical protein